ncbi:MAG: hypothetical protein ACLRWP_13060 [Bilophila wadsworthia]
MAVFLPRRGPGYDGNLRYGTSVIGVGTDESACVAVLARPDNPVFKTKGLNPKHPGVFGSPEDVRGRPSSAPRFLRPLRAHRVA